MNSKKITLYILLFGGGITGTIVASFFGFTTLSGTSILLQALGSCIGIYIWYKMSQY